LNHAFKIKLKQRLRLKIKLTINEIFGLNVNYIVYWTK